MQGIWSMEESSNLQRRDVRIKASSYRTYRNSGHHTRHTRKLHRLEELRDMRGSVHRFIFQESRSFRNNRIRSDSRVVGVLISRYNKNAVTYIFSWRHFLLIFNISFRYRTYMWEETSIGCAKIKLTHILTMGQMIIISNSRRFFIVIIRSWAPIESMAITIVIITM